MSRIDTRGPVDSFLAGGQLGLGVARQYESKRQFDAEMARNAIHDQFQRDMAQQQLALQQQAAARAQQSFQLEQDQTKAAQQYFTGQFDSLTNPGGMGPPSPETAGFSQMDPHFQQWALGKKQEIQATREGQKALQMIQAGLDPSMAADPQIRGAAKMLEYFSQVSPDAAQSPLLKTFAEHAAGVVMNRPAQLQRSATLGGMAGMTPEQAGAFDPAALQGRVFQQMDYQSMMQSATPEERAAVRGVDPKTAMDIIQNLRQGSAADARKAKEKAVDPVAMEAEMRAKGVSPDIIAAAVQAVAATGERPTGTSVFTAITNPQRQEDKLRIEQQEKVAKEIRDRAEDDYRAAVGLKKTDPIKPPDKMDSWYWTDSGKAEDKNKLDKWQKYQEAQASYEKSLSPPASSGNRDQYVSRVREFVASFIQANGGRKPTKEEVLRAVPEPR